MFQIFDVVSDPTLTADRVARLRTVLARRRLDGYIVPRTDEHQGEYIPADAERLCWLTGFSGSAGTAIVTTNQAALFVDGRYTVQARGEVDSGQIDVVAMATQKAEDWLVETLAEKSKIGFDPKLFTVAQIERLQRRLGEKQIVLKPARSNLIDDLWGKDRPPPPNGAILPHPIRYAGQPAAAKISAIADDLKAGGDDAVVLTSRESIAWLTNLRGSDVAHTPVFSAFVIVHQRAKTELFVDTAKLTREAREEI